MAEESHKMQDREREREKSLQSQIVSLIERLEQAGHEDEEQQAMERGVLGKSAGAGLGRGELRALHLWRAVIAECLATFLFVVLVCGAASGHSGAPPALVLLSTALASTAAAATLTHCFRHISGGHMNPAITVAMMVTRRISPVRGALFLAAQSGGGVAGAALLYGLTSNGYQGGLQAVMVPTGTWERFGLEFILTFIVVFTHCVSSERVSPSPALAMGAAYGACSLVSMPQLNPARALGPAFVLNRWEGQWVSWCGGCGGGAAAALLHGLVFSSRRQHRMHSHPTRDVDGDSSAAHSDDDNYDDLDKGHHNRGGHGPPAPPGVQVAYPHSAYSTYRPAAAPIASGLAAYCPGLGDSGLYPSAVSSSKLERVESLYGGTRSLYCKSPTMTRGNLHRSQSVYSKPPRQGPLVPAHNHNHNHNHNHSPHAQNAHNQMQAREETKTTRQGQGQPRPDTVYGMVVSQPRRNHSTQSDDSSYGSYRGTVGGVLPHLHTGNQQTHQTYHIPPPLQY